MKAFKSLRFSAQYCMRQHLNIGILSLQFQVLSSAPPPHSTTPTQIADNKSATAHPIPSTTRSCGQSSFVRHSDTAGKMPVCWPKKRMHWLGNASFLASYWQGHHSCQARRNCQMGQVCLSASSVRVLIITSMRLIPSVKLRSRESKRWSSLIPQSCYGQTVKVVEPG